MGVESAAELSGQQGAFREGQAARVRESGGMISKSLLVVTILQRRERGLAAFGPQPDRR